MKFSFGRYCNEEVEEMVYKYLKRHPEGTNASLILNQKSKNVLKRALKNLHKKGKIKKVELPPTVLYFIK